MPSTLALIRNMFHDEKQRRTAIAIWTGGMTERHRARAGAQRPPAGPLLVGSVFLINIPAMVLLLALGAGRCCRSTATPRPAGSTCSARVLSLAAVLPVIYGIKEIAADGLDLARCLCDRGGPGGGRRVRRPAGAQSPRPMIDLPLFRSRGFTGAVAMNLVAMFAIVGFAVFATQYLQSVLGMSPLTAALWSLVPMAGTMTAAPAAQLLAGRVDRAYIAAGGFGIAGLGFAGLTQLRPHSPIAFLLVCAAIYAGGIVGVMTVGNELVMGAVPPERAGAAAAVVETATEFGAALGIAVLGSIGVAAYRSSLAVLAPAGRRRRRWPRPATPWAVR